MPISFDEILLTLPKLNNRELNVLKERIKVLGQFGLGGAKDSTVSVDAATSEVSDEDFVLRGITEVLFRINGDKQTVGTLRSQPRTMAALRKRLPALMEYLKAVDKAQRHGFFAMCVEMLYSNLRHLNIPPMAPTLVKHLHRIPALVDTHFPSYYKMGLLRHIIRALEK